MKVLTVTIVLLSLLGAAVVNCTGSFLENLVMATSELEKLMQVKSS